MVESFLARSGLASLRVNGVAIHSPYDPVKEADRFVETALPPDPPSTVIVLGEGLGYCSRAIEARFPATRVISLYYSAEVYAFSRDRRTPSWNPGCGETLSAFLGAVIGELDIEGMRFVEWPASRRAFPALSAEANRSLQVAVQQASGSLLTTVAAGRTWLRNCVLNALSLDSSLTGKLSQGDPPILIAAPGPSLEALLPLIGGKRGAFEIWALPSSLLALSEAGIRPDLVVMTDPGHWASVHLHFSDIRCPIAMPLSAARGTWRLPVGIYLFCQPTFFEGSFFSSAGLAVPRYPPHGTVTATAIDIALASTRAPVYLAGVDLCIDDIVSHARPNAFDRLMWLSSSRLSPHYSASFHRACREPFELLPSSRGKARIPLSMKTYAGWLGTRESASLLRLRPSVVELPGMRTVTPAALDSLPHRTGAGGPNLHPDPSFPSLHKRKAIVREMFDEWEAALADGLSRVKASGDPSAIARSERLFSIAFYTEAQALVETRRELRSGRHERAIAAAIGLLERSLSFLASLRGKTGV